VRPVHIAIRVMRITRHDSHSDITASCMIGTDAQPNAGARVDGVLRVPVVRLPRHSNDKLGQL